jgi:hypothetical protein
LTGEAVSAAGV